MLALNLDILDAGLSQNAVSAHARTTQVDFEVDRIFSTRRCFDHHGKGNCQKGKALWPTSRGTA